MSERWGIDGTELYRWKEEDGRLYRVHTSLNEEKLMAENRRIQAEGGAKTFSFGRAVFRMSKAQYRHLIKRFPALNSGDTVENIKAWERLARDPDYRGIVIGKP